MAKDVFHGSGAMIGRWIARLDQYRFKVVHRPRTQHRNADGLSKRTNDYVHREKLIQDMPKVREGFSFMTQQEFEALPRIPYINKQSHPIPEHQELPPELKAGLPLMYIRTKSKTVEQTPQPQGEHPWYPAIQWEANPSSYEHASEEETEAKQRYHRNVGHTLRFFGLGDRAARTPRNETRVGRTEVGAEP